MASPRGESSLERKDSITDKSANNNDENPPAKRQKFSRSRTACLQCRARKSKCGAVPPAACPNCVEAELPCAWPTLDGRSSKARLQRYRKPVEEDLGEGWLDRLLSGATSAVPAAVPVVDPGLFALPSSADANANASTSGTSSGTHTHPHPFPSFATPQSLFPQFTDPAQFIYAVSSRLPTVEDASPERSAGDPSPAHSNTTSNPHTHSNMHKTVKVSWWRPHGQTAIAPGLKKYTLRVRVPSPSPSVPAALVHAHVPSADAADELLGPNGPNPAIMLHLLDMFVTHFGCQFPFVERAEVEKQIGGGTGSVFLLLAIAAIAARFSTHPAVALPHLQPHTYGAVFYARAKAMLGAMLSLPRRETVAAFVLLAHVGFASDSESEVWMMTGLAVRMAVDCGLHVAAPPDMPAADARADRLVFWSVLLMDYALSFGVGRQTGLRPDDITQTLPADEDLSSDPTHARSPFPFAARMMRLYGPLINALNRAKGGDANAARAAAIREYARLPEDMVWNVGNLQRHAKQNQGAIFLHLHLWMHTIIASNYLTGPLLRHTPAPRPGTATPTASLWRNSARTIGDILVLADIINPHAYFALPFVNQAWFVAGCCYVKEIEQQQALSRPASPRADDEHAYDEADDWELEQRDDEDTSDLASPSDTEAPSPDKRRAPQSHSLSRALLASVAATNITTLQQGLAKLSTYWYGAEWISGALRQRVQGIRERDVDLVSVREGFESFVSVPDGGVVRAAKVEGDGDAEEEEEHEHEHEPLELDFLTLPSLPFELGGHGNVNVVETEVPIGVFNWK